MTGALDPLQQSFIDHTAFQCGYCTPGILMSTKALLLRDPSPALHDIQEALAGNYCRCISHYHVLEAVTDAIGAVVDVRSGVDPGPGPRAGGGTVGAEAGRARWVRRRGGGRGVTRYRHIGQPTPRKDAAQIVTGTAMFLDDLTLPHLAYGRVLRSPHAHAEIRSVDTSRAAALPGRAGGAHLGGHARLARRQPAQRAAARPAGALRRRLGGAGGRRVRGGGRGGPGSHRRGVRRAARRLRRRRPRSLPGRPNSGTTRPATSCVRASRGSDPTA